MVLGLIKTLVGSSNDRLLKQYRKVVSKVNAFEANLQALDDAALQAKTAEFKQRVAAGEALDDLAVEAFAVVREASVRVMKMRHFDVQIMGALALHQGKIAEMGTGEGKTLTATLAVYLNALSGKGVHVVTVNDYLAQRDAEWMSKLYTFLDSPVLASPCTLAAFERTVILTYPPFFPLRHVQQNFLTSDGFCCPAP